MQSTAETKAARILVVDDDDTLRAQICRILVADDHLVEEAADGHAGEELIRSQNYDVVLLDVNLPGPSGLALLACCRERAICAEVILITGKPEIGDAVSTIKDGAFDYLAKPVSASKLRARVHDALEARRRQLDPSVAETRVADDTPGTRYRIIRTLGSGGLGTVFLVEKAGHQYAMKTLRPDTDQKRNTKNIKRFMREGEIIGRLDHPNIVKVYELGFGSQHPMPFIVMEYVDGNSLADVMRRDTMALDEKLAVIEQVAGALNIVHDAGIFHRDIKPSNILVGSEGPIKLTDFGIARLNTSTLTMTCEVIGTPAYMAPESFAGSSRIDHRADLFSLGVVAYELLTGRKPWRGSNLAALSHEVNNTRPPPPRSLQPEIPVSAEVVLGRLLQKRPASRYQDAGNLLDDVGRIRRGEDISRGGWFRFPGRIWG